VTAKFPKNLPFRPNRPKLSRPARISAGSRLKHIVAAEIATAHVSRNPPSTVTTLPVM
jgi:hypothetical protein